MTENENMLRVVRFERPDYIPMRFHINGACWNNYPQDALQDLMEAHPRLFPDFKRSTERINIEFSGGSKAGRPFTDNWGCVWETTEDGIAGAVTEHPLASWDDFDGYCPPDPEEQSNWEQIGKDFDSAKANGGTPSGGLTHGHTFLLLSYIRGYEALLYDMADNEPNVWKLIEMVEDFNMHRVRRYLELGAEWMGYPEDLGMQVGPMLSPALLRQFIKPSYQRLMQPARDAGCIVHMHSDGDIRQLVDDLVDGGVEVVNLQDLVNGLDWIKANLYGKTCIDLDIDRQSITRFGTPAQIDALIREEVETLGSKEGGLMMIFGLYPGTPIENVAALMDAMEKYSTYYN